MIPRDSTDGVSADLAGDTAPSDGPYRVADALDDYFIDIDLGLGS